MRKHFFTYRHLLDILIFQHFIKNGTKIALRQTPVIWQL